MRGEQKFVPGATKEDAHVYPVDDYRPHDMNKSCWCKPTNHYRDVYYGIEETVLHNSLDGREKHEQGAPFH